MPPNAEIPTIACQRRIVQWETCPHIHRICLSQLVNIQTIQPLKWCGGVWSAGLVKSKDQVSQSEFPLCKLLHPRGSLKPLCFAKLSTFNWKFAPEFSDRPFLLPMILVRCSLDKFPEFCWLQFIKLSAFGSWKMVRNQINIV